MSWRTTDAGWKTPSVPGQARPWPRDPGQHPSRPRQGDRRAERPRQDRRWCVSTMWPRWPQPSWRPPAASWPRAWPWPGPAPRSAPIRARMAAIDAELSVRTASRPGLPGSPRAQPPPGGSSGW